MQPKFITVTANTAIDFFIEVDALLPGQNRVAKQSQQFAAGKGVNVAKALASLALPVHALGFVGTHSMALFDGIVSDLIRTDFTVLEGHSRTNLTLADKKAHCETHIRTSGVFVTQADKQSFLATLASIISANDIVMICGSLPAGESAGLYGSIIELCHARAAVAILDSSGAGLIQGLQAKPFLIKPNLQELAELVGHAFEQESDVVAAARQLQSQGIAWVIVSLAEKGAIAVNESSSWAATPIALGDGVVVSSVGCGDAMLAGLAVATSRQWDLNEALAFGVACGTANLYSPEPGSFKIERLKQIRQHIAVRCL